MNDDDYFQRYQIGIVFNKEETTVRGDPKDLIAIEDTALTAEYLHDAIVALGYRAIMIPAYGSLENFRKELDQYSPVTLSDLTTATDSTASTPAPWMSRV